MDKKFIKIDVQYWASDLSEEQIQVLADAGVDTEHEVDWMMVDISDIHKVYPSSEEGWLIFIYKDGSKNFVRKTDTLLTTLESFLLES